MNIFSFAYLDFEGRSLALVKAPESLLVDKNKIDQRKNAIDNYEKALSHKTVVLYHEDKWGVKTYHSDDQSLASKLAAAELPPLDWQTYDMDK